VSDVGALIRIAGGPIELEVLPEAGARLHRLRVHGHDLLRTPDDLRPHRDDPYFYGSYPMAPWCNRVAAGPMTVAGRLIDLPASFPDGTAIHGQVSRRPWMQVQDGRFRIAAGGDGWPWRYEVEQRIRIDDARLELGLRLTNRSDGPMPGGIGFHPWFRRPIRVAIAAASVHRSNLATDAEPVAVAGRYDRHALEEMPEGLDSTWTDLAEPPVVLEWPGAGIRATMTVDAPSRFIVAATPPGTDAVAVEPQTHAPDGIRRLLEGEPGGLALIPPDGFLELVVGLAFERADAVGESRPQT
jgi:aldose 1-epimerase